ncbi:MAG: hypothetical protein WC750_04035 [Patescibacteria group bacterium]|jgi:hypothetical protein
METRKIALACFIGGALCSLVALLFAPAFWWLGLIAGFVGGYLAYDFREVPRAVPKAAQAVGEVVAEEWSDVKKSLVRPRPIIYAATLLTVTIGIACWPSWRNHMTGDAVGFAYIVLMGFAWCAVSLFLMFLLKMGVEAERCFFVWPSDKGIGYNWYQKELEKGFTEKPYTYANAYWWIARGLDICLPTAITFLLCDMWMYLAIGIGYGCYYFGLFCRELFELIHSHKRLLCAIDCAIGGAMSYLLLARSAHTLGAQVALVLFGGLLGAGLGVLNWEVVSKRLLHVAKS